MKKIILVLSLVMLLSMVITAGDSQKYGKDITLKETTKISDILAHPDQYEGKKVLVEGTVVGVCEKRGCWIELSGEEAYEKIKVKVNDGEIVFPMEAKGKKAMVEGEVYSIVTGTTAECTDHEKEEKTAAVEGEKTEESCCTGDKEPTKVYMIKGLGAVIE